MGIKRAAIFLIYDPDGIIDRYVVYLLNDISKCLSNIYIICNGHLRSSEEKKLHAFSPNIYVRDNIGYDAGAYKDAILNLIGLNKLLFYDELVIFNDTFFGPFRPFPQIFREMESQCADMWGISWNEADTFSPGHIQSYFLVFRNKLLHSEDFRLFWEELNGEMESHDDIVLFYEAAISQTFVKKGYKLAVYVDDTSYDTENSETAYNHYEHISYQMMKYCNMPLLKRKKLSGVWKAYESYNDATRSLEYIEDSTNYDVDMIWENIIRIYAPHQLYHAFNLNYILSEVHTGGTRRKKEDKLLVIVFLVNDAVSSETVFAYLEGVRTVIDVCIISDDTECLERARDECESHSLKVSQILHASVDYESRRSVLERVAKLIGQYDLICFLSNVFLCDSAESFLDINVRMMNRLENTIKSPGLVSSVTELFLENQRLGVLSSPTPYYQGELERVFKNPWGNHFEIAKRIANTINNDISLNEDNPPFAVCESFWSRPQILLFIINGLIEHNMDLEYEALDLSDLICVLEKLVVFVAKNLGYYSGICECEESARTNIANKNHIIRRLLNVYHSVFSDEGMKFIRVDEIMEHERVIDYCNQFDDIYIYGMGKRARHIYEYLTCSGVRIKGFISSKDYTLPDIFLGHDTYYLSDLTNVDSVGLVIAVSKQFQSAVMNDIIAADVKFFKWV